MYILRLGSAGDSACLLQQCKQAMYIDIYKNIFAKILVTLCMPSYRLKDGMELGWLDGDTYCGCSGRF